MSKKMRNTLLLFKLETTYNVDSTPTAVLNAIQCRAIEPQPLVTEFVSTEIVRPFFGASQQILVGEHCECEFEVMLAGSGTAGTAPKWGPLLRACAFSETVTAGVSTVYAPVTNALESAVLYYYLDGLLHKMTGCRGNVSFGLTVKGLPVMRFKFLGIYNPVTDTPIPAGASYTGFTVPLAVRHSNTPTWSIHSYVGKLQALSVDMANEVIFKQLVGYEGVEINDRAVAGSLTMELDSVTAKDWWAIIRAAALNPLTITHGVTAGNIVKLDAPKAQLINPQYSDVDKTAMLTATLSLQPNVGNDEVILTVT